MMQKAATPEARTAQTPGIKTIQPNKAEPVQAPVVRSSNLQFFLARAEQARDEGDAATLEHVRERCRRSEAAWNALADKARRGERLREQEKERKAAQAAEFNDENISDETGPDGPQDARDSAHD